MNLETLSFRQRLCFTTTKGMLKEAEDENRMCEETEGMNEEWEKEWCTRRWVGRQNESSGQGGGVNKGYKALFSACLQVLPSNREETHRRERAGEHISLYLFLALSLFALGFTLFQNPSAGHTHKPEIDKRTNVPSCSVFTPLRLCQLHSAKALSLISSQDGSCPPVGRATRKRGQLARRQKLIKE